MKYDLEERTSNFSVSILAYLRKIPITITNQNIIKQLLRSATSIGANYQEANGAISKKDFRNKIFICKKEAKETLYWIRLLSKLNQDQELNRIEKESLELTLIFNKISSTLIDKR